MRYRSKLIVIAILIASCNQNSSNNSNSDSVAHNKNKDSISSNPQKNNIQNSPSYDDTTLLNISNTILTFFKNRDFVHLSEYIHPQYGVRFSPYGNTDTMRDKRLSKEELMQLSKSNKSIKWGISDGTGEPINLSISNYIKRFVYDADFLNAKDISVNKIIGEGVSFNADTIKHIYPNSDFIEFYFPGFNPKYQGMDWRALIFVFKKENGKQYLIAVIHDQWRV